MLLMTLRVSRVPTFIRLLVINATFHQFHKYINARLFQSSNFTTVLAFQSSQSFLVFSVIPDIPEEPNIVYILLVLLTVELSACCRSHENGSKHSSKWKQNNVEHHSGTFAIPDQQCQTNVLSRSKAFVFLLLFQKISNIFVFETKFWIETKRFLSVLEKFGSKAFVMVSFQIFWRQLKVLFWL